MVASGISCDETTSAGRAQLQVGPHTIPVQSIHPASAYAGACEIAFAVPNGVSADNVEIQLRVVHYDATVASSNVARIAVAER